MKKREPICFNFLVSDWTQSAEKLSEAIDGHSDFDFVYQKHDDAEETVIEDCEPRGIFNTHIHMELQVREEKQYLVFSCTIPKNILGEEVGILITPPDEFGLKIENDVDNGIVHITNSVGDQYWFYF